MDAASDARKTTGPRISLGAPRRPSGIPDKTRSTSGLYAGSLTISAHHALVNWQGKIAFTLMLSGAQAKAISRELADATLRYGVCHVAAAQSAHASDRAEVHDAATAARGHHPFRRSAGAQEEAREVAGQCRLPVLQREQLWRGTWHWGSHAFTRISTPPSESVIAAKTRSTSPSSVRSPTRPSAVPPRIFIS